MYFMKTKAKVLIVVDKKPKKRKNVMSFEEIIEKNAPNMYEYYYGIGDEDAIKQIEEYRPEIVFMQHNNSKGVLGLLKKVKTMHPLVAVFILLDNVDDENELLVEYMAAGAYKCYCIPPLIINSLIHDMYVALNLE